MSQQLVLDISNATARSKGQARRRNHPALSEDARKAQRNLVRRERARCKKTGKTEQQFLPSAQPLPHPGRPQYCSSFPVKGKTAHNRAETPLLPYLPAFTVLPAHENDINFRALAQSGRYIAAQSRARLSKDIVRDDAQGIGDLGTIPAQHRGEPRITAEERTIVEKQDLDAAGILFEFAQEQYAIPTMMDTETISASNGDGSDVDAGIEYSRKCPVTICQFYYKGFSLKTERDNHTKTHYEGDIKCGFWSCYYERPAFYFDNVEQLRNHVHKEHFPTAYLIEDFICEICWRSWRSFDESSYLEHLDDCLIHAVEMKASERAPY